MTCTEIRICTQLAIHHDAQDECTLHNNPYFETNQINSPQKPFAISLDDFIIFHEHWMRFYACNCGLLNQLLYYYYHHHQIRNIDYTQNNDYD